MKTKMNQIAKMYGIEMNVELVSGVEYDGLTELANDVYEIKINENANDETWTHEFGHVIINEIETRDVTSMSEIANVLRIGNDEVLADILGNLVFLYEFDETPRDMTYVFGSEEELNFVIDTMMKTLI